MSGQRLGLTTYYRTISVDNKPTTVIIGPSKFFLYFKDPFLGEFLMVARQFLKVLMFFGEFEKHEIKASLEIGVIIQYFTSFLKSFVFYLYHIFASFLNIWPQFTTLYHFLCVIEHQFAVFTCLWPLPRTKSFLILPLFRIL